MEPSWSLHLLSEILSAFSTEDPENLRNVVNRVAEAVEAEVAAILRDGRIEWCIGLASGERHQLQALVASKPGELQIHAGRLHTYWAPLGENSQLVVGRLGEPFDIEERSLLRAMARSIELSLRMLEAISAERQARLDASYQASHDALTALPNRVLVLERLSSWIRHPPDDSRSRTAVLFIDIDRFKWVNDAHGHAAGDELLVHVSRVLQRSVRRDDLVGRLSGDEFIVITRCSSEQAAEELARRIITAIRRPIRVSGTELSHSASVGISFAECNDTASSVIENADMAMYRAKALGRGRYALFQPSMREEARERLALEEALRHGVENGEMRCFLQPIMRLIDGELVGFEALARWERPDHGMLSPASFISAAEDCGLIEEIDLSMLQAACDAVGRWQKRPGLRELRISVNVSARTLGAADLVKRVQPILEATDVDPSLVFLEITETSLVEEIPSTASTIQGLRQLGLRLAIDDFGTGYSSLLYLKRFPVGLLKIDQSFVADLGSDPEDEAISQAIVSLARALGVQVVAEGVETRIQEARLLELGCDYGQGYLYASGQPIDVVERRLIEPAASRAGDAESAPRPLPQTRS
ncbi:MAG: EAL domain-containing protein [Cyanobacteriota bacterium]|jgi:diguanylate cyclase (GGDEF)-like protein|nr:EAL domain-containing protein [Cyanobacteriota bacterium]